MHIVAIAWMFVVVLMSLAEATSPQGTLLGAFFTLLLYGLLPLSIVLYLLGTPMRRRARRQAETAEASIPQSDAGGKAAGGVVATERKEP
jgi:membrane protein implicated in regulation of membrane protease activity